jgi:hypothetical protein
MNTLERLQKGHYSPKQIVPSMPIRPIPIQTLHDMSAIEIAEYAESIRLYEIALYEYQNWAQAYDIERDSLRMSFRNDLSVEYGVWQHAKIDILWNIIDDITENGLMYDQYKLFIDLVDLIK